MTLSSQLLKLAHYLAGEFDNREQALAEPIWYVHLRLWQRPVPVVVFPEPGVTLFAEQASLVNLAHPYRPRILHLCEPTPGTLSVRYYMPKDIEAIRGAGENPELLQQLTLEQLEPLPGCTLTVTTTPFTAQDYQFEATLPPGAQCCFTYQGETRFVSLGFTATPEQFLSYDKGIDPATGKALWGAKVGPFRFHKRQDFSGNVINS